MSDNNILVSILIPVYNAEKYIERCARSLFSQTYKNLEFVFVDDCSPDNSIGILETIINQFPDHAQNVKVLRNGKNKGVAASRNYALNNAVGEFVLFVDADDWIEPHTVELLLNKQKAKDADIVSTNFIVHFEGFETLFIKKRCDSKQEFVIQMMQRTWDHCLAGRIVKRTLYFDNNILCNEGQNTAEDRYIMTLLAYFAQNFDNIEEVCYHYERRNTHSITSTKDKNEFLRNNNQELNNLYALESFFKGREGVYYDECLKQINDQLLVNLNHALAFSSKGEFHRIVNIIEHRKAKKDIFPYSVFGFFRRNYFIQKGFWLLRTAKGYIIKKFNRL